MCSVALGPRSEDFYEACFDGRHKRFPDRASLLTQRIYLSNLHCVPIEKDSSWQPILYMMEEVRRMWMMEETNPLRIYSPNPGLIVLTILEVTSLQSRKEQFR